MKFNLKGLTPYEMELIRFCLYDHKTQLSEMIEEVPLSRSELRSAAREMRACRRLISEISETIGSNQ